MSRIHDALKKAEQERQASGAAPGSLETSAEAVLAPPPLHEAPPPTEDKAPMPLAAGPQDKAEPLELLLSQARRVDWSLAAGSVLSFDKDNHALGAEEFRTLRSHLNLVRKQRPLKTMIVSSALPKEGKTFVAANLAQAILWQQQDRVLLVDADLRLPRLHESLGMPKTPGLAEYMRGEVTDFSFVQRAAMRNFFFIPSGDCDGDASELIGNGKLKTLLAELAPVFDWIIIDSSPALPVSDAKLIAEFCDGVLMVVRSGQTPADAARRVAQELRGKHYFGVVLNCADPSSGYSSYYYYYKPGSKASRNGRR